MGSRLVRKFKYAVQTPKHWYERIRYGVSYRDAWSLDGYLSDVIARGAGIIRDNNIGHPNDLTPEEWTDILNEMVESFSGHDEIYDDWATSMARMEKVNRGLDLLRQHYFDLWD